MKSLEEVIVKMQRTATIKTGVSIGIHIIGWTFDYKHVDEIVRSASAFYVGLNIGNTVSYMKHLYSRRK